MKYVPEGSSSNERKFESIKEIKDAISSGEIVEGKVVLCDKDHNLHIDLGVIRGIIPRCEGALGIEDGTVRDIALISKVNKPVMFKIIAIKTDEYGVNYALLSRRIVQLECMRDYVSKLSAGDIINCKVTHLERFGAFIDIGCGINSLIPIDMLSVSRITHPAERVRVGQNINAVLKSVDDNKLTFSLKELLGTWEENASDFSVGETVTGIVRSIENYGVFVELSPNLAGLAEPCDDLEIRQKVSVFIKSILPDKMKVKLVVVEAFDVVDEPTELYYHTNTNHIDRWQYSTPNSPKLVQTLF